MKGVSLVMSPTISFIVTLFLFKFFSKIHYSHGTCQEAKLIHVTAKVMKLNNNETINIKEVNNSKITTSSGHHPRHISMRAVTSM